MIKKEMEQFKKLLLAEREKILEEIQHLEKDNVKKSQRDAAGDISGYTYHMADIASDSYERGFSLNLASNGQEKLYEIDEALRKIEEGSYGKCEQCEGKISKERLKIVPQARLCIKCKEQEESKKGKKTV